MKLTDLDPGWIDFNDRKGLGIKFKCMTGHCQGYQWILFANPLDGGEPYKERCFQLMLDIAIQGGDDCPKKYDRPCDQCRWHRIGDNFETLTMTPSVNAYECGHLTLTNGIFG